MVIEAVVRGELDGTEPLRLCAESPELVTLALLGAVTRFADSSDVAAFHRIEVDVIAMLPPILLVMDPLQRRR